MTMKYTISLLSAAFMMLVSLTAGAQALPFVAAEYGAASLGTAGAGLVGNTNAAAVPFSDMTIDATAGYTLWAPTKANVMGVNASYNLKNKLGVTAGFTYGLNPSYTITNTDGMAAGSFSPTDMMAEVGVSYRFLPFMSVGANVGYAMSSLTDKYSYGAVAADVYVMAVLSDLKLTAGVSNIGTAVTSASGAKFSLPTSVALGAGYGVTFAGMHRVDVRLDADYFLSGDIAVAAGVEYAMNDLAFVRAGYRYGGNSPVPSFASVGAGVKILGIKLDVAYILGSPRMGNTLAAGIGYCF